MRNWELSHKNKFKKDNKENIMLILDQLLRRLSALQDVIISQKQMS